MVRHEAAEALGAIGGTQAEVVLHEFSGLSEDIADGRKPVDRVVRESCDVALDAMNYWEQFSVLNVEK